MCCIGSLLIGRTPEELDVLKRRVKLLSDAGLRSEYLSASDLLLKEPALLVERDSGAAFLPDDCQLDARRAVDVILKVSLSLALFSFPSEIVSCYCLVVKLSAISVVFPHYSYGSNLQANRNFSMQGRYTEFFHDPVTSLLRSVIIIFGLWL